MYEKLQGLGKKPPWPVVEWWGTKRGARNVLEGGKGKAANHFHGEKQIYFPNAKLL